MMKKLFALALLLPSFGAMARAYVGVNLPLEGSYNSCKPR